MEDSPEIVKLLKYILFGYVILCQCVTPVLSLSFNDNSEGFSPFNSDLTVSFTENRGPFHQDGNGKYFNYKNPNELDFLNGGIEKGSNDKGGRRGNFHGEFNSPSSMGSSPPQQNMPPHPPQLRRYGDPFGKFGGSLCSIFKSFLEPLQMFRRCRVSNSQGPPNLSSYSRRELSIPSNSNNNPLESPSNELHTIMNEGNMEQHKMMSHQQRQEIMSSNRDRLIEDLQINHSGEDDEHENNHHPMHQAERHRDRDEEDREHFMMENEGIDPTKVSQSRTMILVPERSCPVGHKRDVRGYCRRLVKIRTNPNLNLEYGPPRNNNNNDNNNNNNNNNFVRSIPIRYYYSRIVAIPAFQFFYPN